MNAEVTPIKTAAETALADAFTRLKAALPGGRDVASLREAAFRRFERSGLPHRRVEEWKYTDLRALMRDSKPLAETPDANAKGSGKVGGRDSRRAEGSSHRHCRWMLCARAVRYEH